MKHLLPVLLTLFVAINLFAQAPQKMTYQAVIREASGALKANAPVNITASIVQTTPAGAAVYVETHAVTTNTNGLVTLEIGQGTAVSGVFENINWAEGPYYLTTDTEFDGATLTGVSQLASVPYALFSDNTAKIQGYLVSNTTPNVGYVLKWNGSAWTPALDETGTPIAYSAGTGISISGNVVSNTAPDVPVTIAGSGITTVSGAYPNFTVTTPASLDNDPTNELQNLSLSGNTLAISGGNSVTLPTGTTYTAGTGIGISGNTISNTAPNVPVTIAGSGITTVSGAYPNFTVATPASLDNDPTNELQNLSLSGNTLAISGGNSVTLPTGTTYSAGTGISISGNTISNTAPNVPVSITGAGATTVSGVYPNFTVSSTDNNTTYTAGAGISISGNTIINTGDTNAADDITNTTAAGGDLSGTYPNPSVVGLQGRTVSPALPTTGDVLKWNGTQWQPGVDATSGGGSYSAGTGISISGNVVSNTAPDVPVTIAGCGATTVSGAYPNFTVTTPASLDNDPTNELQNLSLSGNTLAISGGNSVTLPAGTTYTAGTGIGISGNTISNTAPDVPVTIAGSGITTVSGAYPNFTVATPASLDNDPTNELQNLSLSGNTLAISGGNSVTLPTGTTYTAGTGIGISGNTISNTAPDVPVSITGAGATTVSGVYPNFTVSSTDNNTTYTAGTGIAISGNTITNTGDTNAADDITNTTAAGGDLSGIYPNPSVARLQGRNVANTTPADQQVLKWSAANNRWEPATDATGSGGDNWGSQTAQTNATLTGNGTAATPLGIAQQGATTGQVLKWNGSAWLPAADNNTAYTAGTGISISGNVITNTGDADNSPTNELQTISLSGSTLTLSNGGGSVVLPAGGSGWLLTGNAAATTDFLGTTNNQPLRIRVNNTHAGIIHPTNQNTALGLNALSANTTGQDNVAIGAGALQNSAIGIGLVAVGEGALFRNAPALDGQGNIGKGANNTAVGNRALYNNAISSFTCTYCASDNTAMGYQALFSNTAGDANSAVGSGALYQNTVGGANAALGKDALYANTTGNYNAALGNRALTSNTSGNNNAAIGFFALGFNTTGSSNIAIGDNALSSNTTAGYLVAIGDEALYSNSTGAGSTAPSGERNTAVGSKALRNTSTGTNNTGVGFEVLRANTTGAWNTAVGSYALDANTTGSDNVAFGDESLSSNTTGSNNAAFGSLALLSNTTGSQNTGLGRGANVGGTATINNATAIGYNTTVNASNKVRIGNTSVTVVEGAVVYTTSDARFKQNITEDVRGLDFITRLRPVVYNYQARRHQQFLMRHLPDSLQRSSMENMDFTPAETIRQSGFIAQEVETAAKAAGYDFNGLHTPQNDDDYYSLSYQQFVVPLVKAVQEQQIMIESQNKTIEQLQQNAAKLEAELQQIKALLLQKK